MRRFRMLLIQLRSPSPLRCPLQLRECEQTAARAEDLHESSSQGSLLAPLVDLAYNHLADADSEMVAR
jgi:hypothetical protein